MDAETFASPQYPLTRYALAQSATEITIGSAVHALSIPLGGHILSLNQALILTFATKAEAQRLKSASLLCRISGVTAILKTLSPAGQKISPMIAIGAQGFLFAMGVVIGGASLFGVVLGSILLSLWTFCHSILAAYLIFGSQLFEAIEKLWKELAHTLGIAPERGIWILAGMVGIKLLLAATLSGIAWFRSPAFEARYLDQLMKKAPFVAPAREENGNAVLGALKKLFHPLFLVSFAVSVGFVFFQNRNNLSLTALYALRVLASGFLFFWAVRALPWSWIKKTFPQLSSVAEELSRHRSRS